MVLDVSYDQACDCFTLKVEKDQENGPNLTSTEWLIERNFDNELEVARLRAT